MSATYARRWQKVLAQAARMGRFVSGGVLSFDEAVAEVMSRSYRLGCGNEAIQQEFIAEAIDHAAMEIELAASKRIRAAIQPLIESRKRSAAILHAAHKANLGELEPPVVKQIVKEQVSAALQAAMRRQRVHA